MIQGNKTQQRDPEQIKQQAGERNPEICPAPGNAVISAISSPWTESSAVRALLQPRAGAWLCPSCPGLEGTRLTSKPAQATPKSLTALPKNTLGAFPPLLCGFALLGSKQISQTITELGIKSFGRNN